MSIGFMALFEKRATLSRVLLGMRPATFRQSLGPRIVRILPRDRNLQGWQAGIALFVVLLLRGCAVDRLADGRGEREEAVHFVSGKVTLSGTLVLPGGSGRHSAVVLFHGSGAQSRDLVTARWFAAQGVAALAYDKRGVGESGGDFRAVPFLELSDDGLAGIEYMKSRKEIDGKRVGVWGLSQGGWLGPLAASRSSNVSFVIAVSGPGVSPGEQMIAYYANELRAQGMSEHDVEEASSVRRDIWNYLSSGAGYEQAKTELEKARTAPWYSEAKAQQDDSFGLLKTPDELRKLEGRSSIWFSKEMNYDPVPALRALRVPALFLFGDRDQVIPVAESVRAIRRVLTEDGRHDFTIREFPNDDHGMRLVGGETNGQIDPQYLETMRAWLATKAQKTP
jgi:pimeloyl-ACP methyl ester carboxylesterase